MRAITALVGLAGLACTSETRVVVEVESNFEVPLEADRISFAYRTDPSAPWTSQADLQLLGSGQSPGPPGTGTMFPARFGLFDPDGKTRSVAVRVAIHSGDVEVATREASFDFFSRTVRLRVDHDCAHALCPDGKTCVPGLGCVPPGLDRGGGPIAKAVGPPCQCGNFFPVCVGARSWIRECTPATGCLAKTWVIAEFAQIGTESRDPQLDIDYGKVNTWAFVQVRKAGFDDSRRWIRVVPELDQAFWEKSEWFDKSWHWSRTEYNVPFQIRFDATLGTVPGGPLRVVESIAVKISNGQAGPMQAMHHDEWSVVGVNSPSLPVLLKNHLANFKLGDTVCHRKRDLPQPDAAPVTDQIFCFVRNVGKVADVGEPGGGINLDLNADMAPYELLDYWDVPGCSKKLPPP